MYVGASAVLRTLYADASNAAYQKYPLGRKAIVFFITSMYFDAILHNSLFLFIK